MSISRGPSNVLWHPFENMAQHDHEFIADRADGVHVWDDRGERYIDATAALWFCNVGFGRDEIADKVHEQMRKLPAYYTFGPYANGPSEELSDRLASLSPIPDGKVFLTSGGSDAVDTAGKLARRYWQLCDRPDKRTIVGRQFAYHGMHAFGTSLGGIRANTEGYGGNLVRETTCVPHADIDALEELLERHGDSIAAVIAEPVIGAGGVFPPSDGYLRRLREATLEHDVLLIIDEVICGFGRIGGWFGSQVYEIVPDMILFAKGVTSGYQALGGVIVGPKVQEPFWTGTGADFNHGYTYSGHPSACAAALANLDIMERENLVARSSKMAPSFGRAVSSLADCGIVSDVRSVGLMGAVEIAEGVRRRNPDVMTALVRACWREGVLTRPIRGVALQLSPALTVTESQVDDMVSGLRRAIESVGSSEEAGE